MSHGGDAGELPAESTVDAEPLLCRVLEGVVHGCGVLGSRSTCEVCDARGTHVQVYFCFAVVQTGIRTVPQNHLYQGHSGCTAVVLVTQAAAADALQQQVDEDLASFDPEKPRYQDGWAMEEMQEIFQPLLCRVLGAVVHGCGVFGSRSLRVSFAMHAVRTCKCKFFLLWCKQALEPYPKTTCTRATASVQQ